ncbi:MAG TPA: sigma-70 family RNA polymerase sigma factor [Cytophagales bacterium]|nr:sigma-70 family RNA polymerase sigma factor [Cytophagales bacterium]
MNFKIGKTITEKELIDLCKQRKRSGQQEVYSRYSGKMFGVCLRYLKNQFDAEEVLVISFMKVFEKIDQFESNGSFEGWIRKITVNEALMYLRKTRKLYLEVEVEQAKDFSFHAGNEINLEAEDLMKLIEKLPTGYNTVFNLYAIEGYTHKEIGEMLGISENTSKSQLSRARTLLQKHLAESEFFFNQKTVYYE